MTIRKQSSQKELNLVKSFKMTGETIISMVRRLDMDDTNDVDKHEKETPPENDETEKTKERDERDHQCYTWDEKEEEHGETVS